MLSEAERKKLLDDGRLWLYDTLVRMGFGVSVGQKWKENNPLINETHALLSITGSPITSVDQVSKEGIEPPSYGPDRYVTYGTPGNEDTEDGAKIRLVKRKSFPVFGRTLETYWSGSLADTYLRQLNADTELNEQLRRMEANAEATFKYSWTIKLTSNQSFEVDWRIAETIARHLHYRKS